MTQFLGVMAADVGSLLRMMDGADHVHDSTCAGKSTSAPITRDLLGGCTDDDTQELDLDLQVPCGWEKRLDLKSGKVYLQRCNSLSCSSSTTSEINKPQNIKLASNLEDLNFPPTSSMKTLNLFDDSSSDSKLVSSNSSSYQSVCTLDKVKSALERSEKETSRKRSISVSQSSSSPLSNSSSSVKDSDFDHHRQVEKFSASFAVGCPSCFLYILISKSSPMCPRCNTTVPLPVVVKNKKPRIDLNMSSI